MGRNRLIYSAKLLVTWMVFAGACANVQALDKPTENAESECGRQKLILPDPQYLEFSGGMLAVQVPAGWQIYQKRKNPYFLLRNGEQYQSARTVIYVHIQNLDGSLEQAVKKDVDDFKKNDADVRIENEPRPKLLEAGCPVVAQRFFYKQGHSMAVDQVTKIAIGHLLLNVVLSSDSNEEIDRYKKEYAYLLEHLTVVAGN